MLCTVGLAEKSLGADRDSRAVRLSNESIGGRVSHFWIGIAEKKTQQEMQFLMFAEI